MPSTYTPDRWVLVDLITPTETVRKVFAGWYGGFAGSDSWKLSSEVTTVTEHEDRYEFLNYSGSTYVCYKQSYGTTGYMASIFSSWKDNEDDKISIKMVDEDDVQALSNAKPSV